MTSPADQIAIAITAAAGRLAAVLHLPAAGALNFAVVFCHGFRGSKEGGGRATALAAEAAGLGFAALRFDFTPLSPLSVQVEELRTVIEYCRCNVSRRIILFGRSMGGSASLIAAAADKQVEGLCLWSTPSDLRETFRLSLGERYYRLERGQSFSIADEFGQLTITPEFLQDFDRYDLLACVRCLAGRPLLVVHGENDDIVPLRQAREIYSSAAEPKKLAIIQGGDHRFLAGCDQAAGAVLSWLSETFPHGSPDASG